MANVLCVIEVLHNRPLPVSLEVLGQARRVASELGATLYAVVALPKAPRWGEDDLVSQLAAHGADKVVIATDDALDGWEELCWASHGASLAAVCELLSPSLLLFGRTPAARAVAARSAARLGAAFLADAWIEVRDGRLALFEGSGAEARGLDGELEFAVVATVPPGRYAPASGDDEAEVEVVATTGRQPDFEDLGRANERPRALVVTDGATRAAATALAQALGALVLEPGAAPVQMPPLPVTSAEKKASGKTTVKGSKPRARATSKTGGAKTARAGAVTTTETPTARAAATASESASVTTGSARLAITLGPPCPAADFRVRLGGGAADSDYVVAGDPALLATALARALGGGG